VTGSYRLEGDTVVISARLCNVATGRVEAVLGEISAPASDPMAAVDELRDRGMGAVAALGRRRLGEPTTGGGPAPRYQAYLEYIDGVGRLSWLDRGFEALPAFIRAVRLDSTFAAPLFWATYLVERCVRFQLPQSGWGHCSIGLRDSLFAALERVAPTLGPIERHGLAYLRAMAAGDEDAAWVAISSASRLSPQSLWTAEAIELANERGAFEEVIRLAGAAAIGEGWTHEMSSSALSGAYHALGRFDEELSLARSTRAAFPHIFAHRATELRAMAALGWTDSVRAGLDDMVNRWGPLQGTDAAQMLIRHLRGHGFPEAARALAERCVAFFFADSANSATYAAYMGAVCLHGAGRPTEARRLFERIVAEGGQFREFSLQWLGVLAAQAENRSLAEQYLRQLIPPGDDSTHMISRARIAAALGDHEQAVSFLRRAIADNPFWRAIHKDAPDPGWESIQSYPPYRALIDGKH
jgi:tetratricopeptide (TPR) repeat protein